MKDSQPRHVRMAARRKYIKVNNERFSTKEVEALHFL